VRGNGTRGESGGRSRDAERSSKLLRIASTGRLGFDVVLLRLSIARCGEPPPSGLRSSRMRAGLGRIAVSTLCRARCVGRFGEKCGSASTRSLPDGASAELSDVCDGRVESGGVMSPNSSASAERVSFGCPNASMKSSGHLALPSRIR
jgi:hypothetical protein